MDKSEKQENFNRLQREFARQSGIDILRIILAIMVITLHFNAGEIGRAHV